MSIVNIDDKGPWSYSNLSKYASEHDGPQSTVDHLISVGMVIGGGLVLMVGGAAYGGYRLAKIIKRKFVKEYSNDIESIIKKGSSSAEQQQTGIDEPCDE